MKTLKGHAAWKIGIVVNIILLLVLCSILLLHYFPISDDSDPKGTYCTGGKTAQGGWYLVLNRDGGYVLYEQFHLIESGSISDHNDYDGFTIYTIKSENGVIRKLVYEKDTIVLLNYDNRDIAFEKLSSDAAYINVDPDAELRDNDVPVDR